MAAAADEGLRALLREVVGDGRLILVSNRGPLSFEGPSEEGGAPHIESLTASRGSGGLVTALAELGRHAPLTWIAAALSDGDRVAAQALHSNGPEHDLVSAIIREQLPNQDVELDLQTFPPEMYDGYYRVVSNPFLWFLQHQMYALPYAPNVDMALLDAWRLGYRPVNAAFAQRVVEMAQTEDPVVLLQDYHVYLAAPYIRERLPKATILHFTHIPWPGSAQWQVLPQGLRRAICEGLLACDIVGLQTDRYADAFLDTVVSFIREAGVDGDGRTIRWRDRRIRVRSYPISLDPDRLEVRAHSAGVAERMARLDDRLERAGRPKLIVRADRLEPSKNALRGFLAFEELLARRPELRTSVRFLAVHATSRTELPDYAEYARNVREVVARINGMGEPEDQPIWLYDGSDYEMVLAAMRSADVMMVNPVLDGMNLVAKEAALIGDRDPVLILSETAGAAEQLGADAFTVAPADVIGLADILERALEMGPGERHVRARRLRARVRREDLSWWISRQLRDLAAVRRGLLPPSRRLHDTVRERGNQRL